MDLYTSKEILSFLFRKLHKRLIFMLELCLSYCSDFLLFFYESNLKKKNSVAHT